jgi:hypothetical protein
MIVNMYEVKDGVRTLQFEGVELGESTSRRRDSTRWIEFKLYRTESGSYILSRIGVSLVYHGAACPLVRKYNLQELSFSLIDNYAIACEQCNPSEQAELVFPEKHRYWAQVSEEPNAVLEALYKYDEGSARYLTNVAQRLLESASANDSGIESVYKIELIP